MSTYKRKVEDPEGRLDRPTAFGDHETWFAERREAERLCWEFSTSGAWPEGHAVDEVFDSIFGRKPDEVGP